MGFPKIPLGWVEWIDECVQDMGGAIWGHPVAQGAVHLCAQAVRFGYVLEFLGRWCPSGVGVSVAVGRAFLAVVLFLVVRFAVGVFVVLVLQEAEGHRWQEGEGGAGAGAQQRC